MTSLGKMLYKIRKCILINFITLLKVKGVRRKRTQVFDDLRNRKKKKRYWELKEEVEDQKEWSRQFINQT